MPRTQRSGALLDDLGEPDGIPLYRHVYRRIREQVLAGSLASGTRLPSTRTLAADAGISRKTAEEAYAQLETEGYVVRRTGSGTFVAEVSTRPRRTIRLAGRRTLSARGRAIAATTACVEPSEVRAFGAGLPALDAFPFDVWQRLVARRARQLDARQLVYGDPAGYAPLREAIAAYVASSRGVICEASQVVIVSSSQQALDLAARLLLDPGDEAWLEDPFYPGARAAFLAAGARPVAVPVDDDGIDVAHGVRIAPNARVAYVTPSHQYPLGVTTSLERRLALLDWARRSGAWIVEDDYDGEFRYDGRPVASIQGLDCAGRVLYVGTFTKVLYPSLRLGYLILPPDLVRGFVNARTQIDGHPSTLMQSVTADFLSEGHFAAHVRRMRSLYRARRDVLLEAAFPLREQLTFPTTHAGLRATGIFTRLRDDVAIATRAARAGIDVAPLSRYCLAVRRPGLVLGYAGLSPAAIRAGMAALAEVIT
jgi:GntR family transcriptional regulator/MocR family aminotransferase